VSQGVRAQDGAAATFLEPGQIGFRCQELGRSAAATWAWTFRQAGAIGGCDVCALFVHNAQPDQRLPPHRDWVPQAAKPTGKFRPASFNWQRRGWLSGQIETDR